MILTDTHTHLYTKEYDADRDEIIKRAVESGVSRLFMPCIDDSSLKGMMELTKRYPDHCFPMVGLHPCSVTRNFETELQFIEEYLNRKELKFYAIGEAGLDLYWDTTYSEQQEIALHRQIELALKHQLPIVLHVRKAFRETYSIIQQYNDRGLRGIFHCFSGTLEEAEQVLSLSGFSIGVGGVVTFKNGGLQELLPHIPLERLVLETDSPYLAPVPHRGKRNESMYLTLVAQKVAEFKKLSIEQVADQTTKNSIGIFGI